MPNPIANLVFQGGSVKGIAYIGALEALEKEIDMTSIRRVSGASAGAITACLLALGCNVKQVKDMLLAFDFKKILDEKEGSFPTQSKLLKSVEKHEQGKSIFFSKIPAKSVKIPLSYSYLKEEGVYEGEYFREWMANLILTQVQTLTEGVHDGLNLTFLELHELTIKYPGLFRDLFVVGSNLTQGGSKIFSFDNPETQHVIIADAIRISMSIPVLFKPHHVYFKIDGERLVDVKRDAWVDGGFYENYPIDCFDDKKYIEAGKLLTADDGKFYNPETLGFRLVSKERKDYCEGASAQAPENMSDKWWAYSAALGNARSAIQESKYDRAEHKQRTVYINHLNISTLAFNISEENQQALIQSGQEALMSYLKTQDTPLQAAHTVSDTFPSI